LIKWRDYLAKFRVKVNTKNPLSHLLVSGFIRENISAVARSALSMREVIHTIFLMALSIITIHYCGFY